MPLAGSILIRLVLFFQPNPAPFNFLRMTVSPGNQEGFYILNLFCILNLIEYTCFKAGIFY
jgi:hypothetical protein